VRLIKVLVAGLFYINLSCFGRGFCLQASSSGWWLGPEEVSQIEVVVKDIPQRETFLLHKTYLISELAVEARL
jgi:hypothetical protein